MSIVVAVRKGGVIAVASDTQNNFGSFIATPDNHQITKVRKVGGSLLASTGWGIYDNILDDFLTRRKRPALTTKRSIFEFFMKLWGELHDRYTLVKDQAHPDDHSPFADLDASFLVANRSGIFLVSSDMSVTEFKMFHAIGSGADFAMGALAALYQEKKYDAGKMARRAVQVAIDANVYCGGEIELREIKVRR